MMSKGTGGRRLLVAVLAMATCLAPGASGKARAAGEAAAPEIPAGGAADEDVFTIAVMGDSFADGIWGGLYRRLQRDPKFEILRLARNSTGLARPDYYDWQAVLEDVLADHQVDAAIVALGINDNQELYVDGRRRYLFATAEWDRLYRERVEAMMGRLFDAGVPTFWIGLPAMRDDELSREVSHLNAIFEDCAGDIGVTFIPTWAATVDEEGEFASHLKDEDGRPTPIRMNDGVHFTGQGYTMLTTLVLEAMRGELAVLTADEAS